MALVKSFNEIVVSVELLGRKRQLLDIGEDRVLVIPEGMIPNAFRLILHAGEKTRVVFAQKDVSQENGGYTPLPGIEFFGIRLTDQALSPPIQVIRVGENVWTMWHNEKPNRIDCWFLDNNGHLELFQVGVVTHDDGTTFRLLGECRWKGQIFKSIIGFSAKPEHQRYGPLLWNKGESRENIRQNAEFWELLTSAHLSHQNCSQEELYPPLGPIPNGCYARVDWFIPFAGQKGQGIAKDAKGNSCWILGQDLGIAPDADGIKRLWHNDLISYTTIQKNWGPKLGSAKLLGIEIPNAPTEFR